ncbi:MAG: glutamine--fructose-6-phosphate transaminase (isomerizing) [Bacteroidales bacterium]
MCGIVGYIGNKDAYPILINGLKRLEYRGYDSAGIALINNNDISLYKTKGKVVNLERFVKDKNVSGTVGIGHTRWATHGEPNDVNAHPHYSQTENIALIHNGIIENYLTLKKKLIEKGYTFRSDTDTEVLVYFIEYIQKLHDCSLLQAVQLALTQVVGAYAIAIVDKRSPNQIIAAKKASPMVIGIGEDEYFIGSDATALVEYTNKVIYIEDDEVICLEKGKDLQIFNLENVKKSYTITELEMNLSELEKGGYPHFMIKEIMEQPEALKNSLKGRINIKQDIISLSGIRENRDRFINARRIIIVACGTSWHAGKIGEYLIEDFARIPVEVEYASEFRYRNPVLYPDDIVIAISQSGETADTLAAVKMAKDQGIFVYGICNVVGSSIPRATDSGSYTHVGPEIGVASTKSFTAQVCTLSLIALCIAKERNTISPTKYKKLVKELASIPDKMKETLKCNEIVKKLAPAFTYAKNFMYLGRGYCFPVALEGALKLKEISYIHAEGYPAAEMKHGPIALIDQDMPSVVIAPTSTIHEKTLSNIKEIKARKGRIFSIITMGDSIIKEISDYYIEIPNTEECFVPLLAILPLQLLSYYVAVAKGCNVDQPRNLAKSVTVE